MVRLLKRDFYASSPVGGSHRITGANSVYPSGSPVRSGQRKQPRLLTCKQANKKTRSLREKIGPLLEARAQANKVYSNSYFENHYPEADKDLKSKLDEKIMAAHSRLKSGDDEEEQEEQNAPGITIVLNIGK